MLDKTDCEVISEVYLTKKNKKLKTGVESSEIYQSEEGSANKIFDNT